MTRRAALAMALTFAANVATAQGVRVNGATVLNYVELQPVAEDSIRDNLTTGTGLVRDSPIGLVTCPEGHPWCYFYRSLDVSHTLPLVQDVEMSGWGFGEGVSVYAHVRARANLGGVAELWTRAGDRFTALAAYAEMDRGRWRARLGRQWTTSALGLNNFDGASLAMRVSPRWSLEGYAGSSLIEGLSETPTSSELAAADAIPPDVRGIVVGAVARWRPGPGTAMSAEYQRELRNDRAGLYSDRVDVNGAVLVGAVNVTGTLQADLASTAINEFRVRAARPLRAGITGGIEAIHYTPFFPLWTIWGVFAPVGYNEARADGRWSSVDNTLAFSLAGGYRRYQDTHTGVGFLPMRDDGWTVIGGGTWRWRPDWAVEGSYRRDIGFGASKSDGNAAVRWRRGDGTWVALTGSAVQNIFEFGLPAGYLLGGGVDVLLPLTPELNLVAQMGIYRQIAANTPATTVNWSQRRALIRLEWGMGGDPGLRTRKGASAP